MKNRAFSKIVFGLVLCVYVVSGCSKSSSSNNQCNFSTGSAAAASGAEVSYSATGTGSASLSSIVYQGIGGEVKVSNPTLPWSVSFGYQNGGTVELSAEGTAANGGVITLSYGINASGSFSSDTVSCGH